MFVQHLVQSAQLFWGGVCLYRYDYEITCDYTVRKTCCTAHTTANYRNSLGYRAKKSVSQWEEFMAVKGNHFDS